MRNDDEDSSLADKIPESSYPLVEAQEGGKREGGGEDGANNNNNNSNSRKKQQHRTISSEERSIPFNCSMPYSDLVRLESEASKLGISRSELLRRAIQLYYHYQEQEQ